MVHHRHCQDLIVMIRAVENLGTGVHVPDPDNMIIGTGEEPAPL